MVAAVRGSTGSLDTLAVEHGGAWGLTGLCGRPAALDGADGRDHGAASTDRGDAPLAQVCYILLIVAALLFALAFPSLPYSAVVALWLILAAVLVVLLMICASGSLSVLASSRIDVKPVDDRPAREALAMVLSSGHLSPDWAADHGFLPLGVYQVVGHWVSPLLVLWKRGDERTYLCAYVMFGRHFMTDFVTKFESGGLTTGNSKDGQMDLGTTDTALKLAGGRTKPKEPPAGHIRHVAGPRY